MQGNQGPGSVPEMACKHSIKNLRNTYEAENAS